MPNSALETAHGATGGVDHRSRSASLGFLVFGNVGMAAAANGAVPGDVLYPVDLGYEYVVGLLGGDVGGAGERLEEASVLIERGQLERALDTIGVAAGEFDSAAEAAISALSDRLDGLDANAARRVDLHRATVALLTTVQEMVGGEAAPDLASWKHAINDSVKAVADTAQGDPHTPPGQDDTFVPPGQEDGSTPPGLDEKPTPPGQDDTFIPPGQDGGSTPPGLVGKPTPPGHGDTFTPPGQDRDAAPPGRIESRGRRPNK